MPSTREPQSIHEMLRIMDVATALRQSRELAEQELALDETKSRLRERLRAAALESGDAVNDAEIDTAIDQYYASLHTFAEPTRGLRVFVARAWVRRTSFAIATGAVLIALTAIWGLFLRETDPWAPLNRTLERARAVATDDAARSAIAALEREAGPAHANHDFAALERLAPRVGGLLATLDEEYELHVVSRQGELSGIDAYFTDDRGTRSAGWYLIVEARTSGGAVLERTVRDAEQQRDVRVRKWGEQVDKAVYDRIAADKQQDGIVDESLFARKRRGALSEVVVMPGIDGTTPLQRGRRITTQLR
ncbi:MAG: hypothetical protein HZB39_05855 [Planctomycetes bacterium]|nr:hypothetical protein [Planctomycetota bacterium]